MFEAYDCVSINPSYGLVPLHRFSFRFLSDHLMRRNGHYLAICDLTPQNDRYVAQIVSLLLAKIIKFGLKYEI